VLKSGSGTIYAYVSGRSVDFFESLCLKIAKINSKMVWFFSTNVYRRVVAVEFGGAVSEQSRFVILGPISNRSIKFTEFGR
jgi:hypothetical protein